MNPFQDALEPRMTPIVAQIAHVIQCVVGIWVAATGGIASMSIAFVDVATACRNACGNGCRCDTAARSGRDRG
jgi:predicted TIM-barrel enzyme